LATSALITATLSRPRRGSNAARSRQRDANNHRIAGKSASVMFAGSLSGLGIANPKNALRIYSKIAAAKTPPTSIVTLGHTLR